VKASTMRRLGAIAAAGTVAALALSGCAPAGGGDADAAEYDPEADVTLTVTTFGTFGYEDLYKEYMELHPNVTIKAKNIDTGGNAKTDLVTKLGAGGKGVSDIVAIEEGWLGEIMNVSDMFTDLRDFGIEDRKGDWVDWKYETGTDAEGRVIGYGTDIGPTGLCYNKAAFEAAGFPTDREEVAKKLEGDWEHYFEVGQEYVDASGGKAWFDHAGFVWNSIVNQQEEGYYTKDGELNIEDNAELREKFDLLADAVEGGQSAAQEAWNWNEGKSFTDGTFATFVCPGWMLGTIKGKLESAGATPETSTWDFADVFPGGAGNWGGAWLSIPETSEKKAAAAALADWLTQPEQQVKQSAAAGNFPSTVKAQETLAADATPNEWFNDSPTGAILASRAEGVVAQFKGPKDSEIQEKVFGPALQVLDTGEGDADAAWDKALGLLKEIVK